MKDKLVVYGLIAKLLIMALWHNPDLLYYALPRYWRGGYKSPWNNRD